MSAPTTTTAEWPVPNLFGTSVTRHGAVPPAMNPLSGFTPGSPAFDPADSFVPENVPMPGSFLDGHDVLAGVEHAAFHRLSHDLFEERGVYDMTFGYNLARLNLDPRHPDAGFRYAREGEDPSVLRAEFTPTTEFCPQSDTLTLGAFRAWNGRSDPHEYELVRVRVADEHHQSVAINGKLAQLEEHVEETGELPESEGPGGPSDAGSEVDGADVPASPTDRAPF